MQGGRVWGARNSDLPIPIFWASRKVALQRLTFRHRDAGINP